MTTRIHVDGYIPFADDPEVDTVIEISGKPKDYGADQVDWLVASQKYHRDQAQLLADALVNSLPGGTLHALTVRLLEHRVNVLKIKESNHE